jgi:ATP-binding cassette, subfamily F, member 3
MSSEDIAEEIRDSFPGTEEVIVQYLSGYLVDDAAEEEDVLQVARELLISLAGDPDERLEKLMRRIGDILEDQLKARQKNRSAPKLQKLDRVMDMSKTQMSNTIALSEGVDLESINKGKCVDNLFPFCIDVDNNIHLRASKVDMKKLEKQEAKLRVCALLYLAVPWSK